MTGSHTRDTPTRAVPSDEQEREAVRKRIKRDATRKRIATIGSQLLVFGVVAVAWQGFVELKVLDEFWSSSPLAVASAVVASLGSETVVSALGYTLFETLVGFAISAVVGIAAGVVLFEVPWLYYAVRPLITLFNNTPRLIFAPLLVLYFGIGPASRIANVVMVVFLIVLLNTVAGLQSMDSDRVRLAKALGAGRVATFTKFRFPAAVPTIFVGLQLGLNFAFVSAVVAEMLTGGEGLGALVSVYSFRYEFDRVFAVILIMALVGTALAMIMRAVEDRLLAWRRYEFRGLR